MHLIVCTEQIKVKKLHGMFVLCICHCLTQYAIVTFGFIFVNILLTDIDHFWSIDLAGFSW